MPQYAIAYAPNLSGGAPADTTQTGSFYIGRMGNRSWNQVVPQTTVNTLFYASPLTGSAGYVMAIPKAGASPSQPQFFHSMVNGTPVQSDAGFISVCNYMLKTYATDGSVNPGSPANPAGCASVGTCQAAFTSAGWFQDYGFVPPA